jgi:hypothetical protein
MNTDALDGLTLLVMRDRLWLRRELSRAAICPDLCSSVFPAEIRRICVNLGERE